MSFKTVEVELENGHIRAAHAETLPEKARALLTILETVDSAPNEGENMSVGNLAADLAGIGKGKYADLSTNKTHMDDFGR